MSANERIKSSHLQRWAYVYVRQSTAAQVQYNRESTNRQYKLAERAVGLGWSTAQVKIIDEDLARSGSATSERSGFAMMTTEVALGHVGLILSIEVSRVARNSADWYRLLDLCGVTDTLIGDEDGLYHPGLFNDRLLLGLKGTMAEAELHVIRARLEGGIRNKAARGELRRGLPVGFLWGEQDGDVRSTLIKPSQEPFTPSSKNSPKWARSGKFGSGFSPKAFAFLYSQTLRPRSDGSSPPIPPFITS